LKVIIRPNGSRVDPEKRDAPNEGVADRLEDIAEDGAIGAKRNGFAFGERREASFEGVGSKVEKKLT
jgi:hypothetical protein